MQLALRFSFEPQSVRRFGDSFRTSLNASQPGAFQEGMYRAMNSAILFNGARFAQYSAGGGDWADHAESTKEKKAREYGVLREKFSTGGKGSRSYGKDRFDLRGTVSSLRFPLLLGLGEDGGKLERSIDIQSDDTALEYSDNSITWTNNVPYGVYHQTGTTKMPKRVWIISPEGDEPTMAEIRLILQKAAADQMNGNWGTGGYSVF